MALRKSTAIVVGGGPAGLAAALGLTRAGIDFVVLENRKNIVVEDGSDITLLPMTMDALEQLNLVKPLSAVWNPVSQINRIDHNGREIGKFQIFKYIYESTGYYPSALSRRNLLSVFYQALGKQGQDKILTDKKVSKIQRTSDGVTVSCADGTAYDGAFVIGADGAHSIAREWMRKLALSTGSRDLNEAEPFLTTYQALWVRFPTAKLPGCTPGTATETHGYNIATQLFAGEDTSTVGVYKKLATPTRQPPRYNETDQEALIKEWGHLPLVEGSGVLLKDAYEARMGSGLVNLEEGVLPQWSWDGRIVLVGDAAHKFTPSAGSGLNHAIIDAVLLVNELHGLSNKHGGDRKSGWDRQSLSKAFQSYQKKRLEDVTVGYQQSSGATAMATWTNVVLRLLDQYVLPNSMVQRVLGMRLASTSRSAKPLVFDFE